MSPSMYSGLSRRKSDGEREHQERADHPVLHEREHEDARVAEDLAELLVADLRERRVHHEDEPDRDRDRRRADAHAASAAVNAGAKKPSAMPTPIARKIQSVR